MKFVLPACVLALVAGTAVAEPVTYQIDPGHTYPSFQADHMGGVSFWRGKFDASSGSVVLDKDKSTGTVDITVDATSIDFGNPKLNEHAKKADMFDTEKFPTATYKGTLGRFKKGAPTEVKGELTLHGVTKPVTLKINQFLCKTNAATKKETCGADASTTINREDFGIAFGKALGFNMEVTLQIQIEAGRPVGT